MRIVIESVASQDDAAVRRIRQQVFEREMGIPLERLRLPPAATAFHLLARLQPHGNPVAALTVLDTTDNPQLHLRCGLRFGPAARVARYTQLAVLLPYRGMNLPLRMILEARRRFVAPQGFDYTWLLFDAERASSSSMCKWLAFIPGSRSFPSEYGRSRALARDERATASQEADRRAEKYIEQAFPPLADYAGRIPVSLESARMAEDVPG